MEQTYKFIDSIYAQGMDVYLLDNISTLESLPPSFYTKSYMGLLVIDGHCQYTANGERMEVKARDFLLCYPNVIMTDPMMSPNWRIWVIFITENFTRHIEQSVSLSLQVRAALDTSKVFHLNEAEFESMKNSLEFVHQKMKDTDMPNYKQVLDLISRGLAYEFLGRMQRHLDLQSSDGGTKSSAARSIFSRFSQLIEGTKCKNQPVSWWADRLHITPKYLSLVCQTVVGRPASTIINNAIIQDANLLLQDPSLSIKQIADQLGFANQSHFGTFYKRHTGHSPIEQRQS